MELYGEPWERLPDGPADDGPSPVQWLKRHLMDEEGLTAEEAVAEIRRRRAALKGETGPKGARRRAGT